MKIRRQNRLIHRLGEGYFYGQREIPPAPPTHTHSKASIKILIEERLRSSDAPPPRYALLCNLSHPKLSHQAGAPPTADEGGFQNTLYPPTSIQTQCFTQWVGVTWGIWERRRMVGGGQQTSEVLKIEAGSIFGYTPFPGHMVGVNRWSRRRTDRIVHCSAQEFWVKATQILFCDV